MITNSPAAHCELRDCSKFAYCCVIHPELGAAVLTLRAAMMWAKISCSTQLFLGFALLCLLNWYQCYTWKLAQFSRNRSGAYRHATASSDSSETEIQLLLVAVSTCYMLMNPILLFCSTFIFLLHSPPETPADTPLELHLCRLSVCAIKGQTETRAHCELIPVKCLLCLCNGFQPAAPHCERMGVCATWSHKRKSAWKFHIQRKVEAHQ